MTRVVMAGLIASFLTMLTGCKSEPFYHDTSALENPPPKPPNCPNLPELENITLADGNIADVRVFWFIDRKFYIPSDSLESAFIDDNRQLNGGFIEKNRLGVWRPDLHRIECPGVVHVANSALALSYRLNDGRKNETKWYRNASVRSEVNQVRFMSNVTNDTDNIRKGPGIFKNTAYVRIYPSVMATYSWPPNKDMSDSDWAQSRDSARELFDWLTTPPRQRKNDHQFAIGIRSE